MNDWILRLIEGGGYWGIFFLMVLENILPPVPSEVIMGLGGVAVARGTMDFWPLLIVGTVGSTLGNYFWFMVGSRIGYRRLKPFFDRWGRWLAVEWDEVEKVSAVFRKHGQWVIFVLRFMPLMRTMISLPAGLAHMSRARFLAFTFAGTAIWNFALIEGGRALAHYLENAGEVLNIIAIAGVVLALGWYLWRVITWKHPE